MAPRKDDEAFAWLVEKCGGVANLRPSSSMSKLFKHGGPSKTREFRRIHALPRRVWEDDPHLDELVELLTKHLSTSAGEMTLWPVQAAALRDLFDRRGLFAPIAVGAGKAIPDNEEVLHERGWTQIKDVRPGDSVYGSDGKLHQVIGVFPQGVRPVYRLVFSDRTSALSDVDHLWTFKDNQLASKTKNKYVTKTLREYLEEPLFRQTKTYKISRWFLPMTKPVEYPRADLPIDPYTLGALLGDGGLSQITTSFTTMDRDILERLILPEGVTAKTCKHQSGGLATYYNLTVRRGRSNHLRKTLDALGLKGVTSHSKFIPKIYRYAGVDQRLELLRGLLDTDGEHSKASAGYSSVSRQLAEQVQELAESLGASATFATRPNHFRVTIRMPRGMNPFFCKRKKDSYGKYTKQRPPGRSLQSIEKVGDMPCTCLAVYSADHLFHVRHHILTHNSLISLLAATLLQAERPLLIVPAQVREQTNLQVVPEMEQHWNLHPNLRVITYWDLSQEFHATILEDIAPDLIIGDEIHRLKNRGSGRTKRMSRYMNANPETIFVALSGTVTNRSIRDYDHILRWCLKKGTPLPETWQELCQWADVLDVMPEELESSRSPAGALEVWATGDLNVRQGYRDRLVQTPGVIATKSDELGTSLLLKERRLDVPDQVAEMLAKLALTWETPNGDLITEAVDLWRHARELCVGFFYRWDPPPPRDWLEARKAWKQHVRETLKHNRRRLDTELQVWNEEAGKHDQPRAPILKATDDEDLTVEQIEAIQKANAKKKAKHERELAEWRVNVDPEHCFWCKWLTIRHTFKINNVAEWVDDFAIVDAAKWLDEVGGIVWTEHTQWAERLAKVSGVRFFGPGKKANIEILTHTGPMIASIKAHGEGKNLQHHHNTSLVVAPPSSGKTWEQVLGRQHRPGQQADEVIYEVYTHADELRASIKKAFGDAHYLEHTLGTRQKLLYADKDFEVRP